MKQKYMRWKQFPFFVLLISGVFISAGCSTLVEKSGEVLDGSAFDEKTTAIYRSGEKGSRSDMRIIREKETDRELLVMTSEAFPGLELYSTVPVPGYSLDAAEIEFIRARILSSHVYGWNEFSLDLFGTAHCILRGYYASLEIDAPPERIQVSEGMIRLKSRRLTGGEALTSLRNRRERILALAEWMEDSEWGGSTFSSQKEFENYWKPILFPELVKKKERPQVYSTENAQWIRTDSIRWNKTYTEFLFPEELWELRNSGALLRDWEEAVTWIFYECHWDSIIASLNGIRLTLR
ncbi:hypothetical protein K7I13_10025 [Brucepastera parasyntrophica]|uniref:hypothetical protein n=1 Tax=Brucepastera parasyntrophica TaxID=2880008 RepID=UPI00210882EB|nr:hypothetical protein [Brucepastera parasyntrophica]ULQ58865.1 hypothetical protein K7I13_10025 [Brucepastera parasyntrophica]